MPLRSMTGFARADGTSAGAAWTWEIRSVNGKGLDLRIRVAPGFEFVEVPVREKIATRLTRGNVQVNLSVKAGVNVRLGLNQEVLGQIEAVMSEIEQRFGVGPVSADGILGIRGVLETEAMERDEESRALLSASLLAGLAELLDDLVDAREREGVLIGGLLETRLDELGALVAGAEASPARTPDAIRARLAEQVGALVETQVALDPNRLHQEAVLLATKADIREELDRLGAHIGAARDLLQSGGVVGRKLDFLSQELNREVNTLCAKSNDLALTEIGLEMKAAVDQFREQVQNLE